MAFEFNQTLLCKLAQHTYSSLFGTFLCNSLQESEHRQVPSRTFSVWSLLHPSNECIRNLLYDRHDGILWPQCNVSDIHLWRAVYCEGSKPAGASHLASCAAAALSTTQPPPPTTTSMERSITKAHSCESLPSAVNGSVLDVNGPDSQPVGSPPTSNGVMSTSMHRTNSDSNLQCATHITQKLHTQTNHGQHNQPQPSPIYTMQGLLVDNGSPNGQDVSNTIGK